MQQTITLVSVWLPKASKEGQSSYLKTKIEMINQTNAEL